MSLSDRIIVMNKGKIVQIGTPHQVYRDPVDAFVAGFIGKVAFFPAEVRGIDEVCTVDVRGKTFRLPRFSEELKGAERALVMCRPESLTLLPPGEGILDGRVTTNVYLGHSIESFVATEMGEILVRWTILMRRVFEREKPSPSLYPNDKSAACRGSNRSKIYKSGAPERTPLLWQYRQKPGFRHSAFRIT